MRACALGLSVGLCLPAVWLGAQAPRQVTPPLLSESLVGRDLFMNYCAGCHGREGTGNGPVAGALKIPPADLTTLARRHGGRYPASLVEDRLNGTRGPDDSTAHGTTAMPIWGDIFRQLDAKESTARVRVRNLIDYVGTIQK
jgi:mono/diheme cytochrome c family protein